MSVKQSTIHALIKKAERSGYQYNWSYDSENDKQYVKTEDMIKYNEILRSGTFLRCFFGIYPIYDLDISLNGKLVKKCGLECWTFHAMMLSVNDPVPYLESYL